MWIGHAFLLVPAQARVAQQLESVKPASFNTEEVLGTLEEGRGG